MFRSFSRRVSSPPPPSLFSGPPPDYGDYEDTISIADIDTAVQVPESLTPPPDTVPESTGVPGIMQPTSSPHSSYNTTPLSLHHDPRHPTVSEAAASSSSSLATSLLPVRDVILRWDAGPQPQVERPIQRDPTTYTFSQLSSGTMLLIPPSTDPDSRPVYHISVQADCAKPTVHTTVIRHGGRDSGPLVGFFRMGLAASVRDVISFNGQIKPMANPTWFRMSDIVPRGLSRQVLWRWAFGSNLIWEWEQAKPRRKTCTFATFDRKTNRAQLVAILNLPDESQMSLEGVYPPAELTVTPRGHAVMDAVVLTALMLQRERFDTDTN